MRRPESSTKRSNRPRRPARAAPSGSKTWFIADAMLGSLARKLRALGFDTLYYRSGDDSGVIREAAASGRVILTADRSLFALSRAKGLDALLLTGRGDPEKLSEISRLARESGIPLKGGDPLCSVCGGVLMEVKKDQAGTVVPQRVLDRHRLFFRCGQCGKVYWHGSHWKKLRSLGRRLETT